MCLFTHVPVVVAPRTIYRYDECDEGEKNALVFDESVRNNLVIKRRYFQTICLITGSFMKSGDNV